MVKKFALVVLLLSPLLVTVFVALSSVPVVASQTIIRVPDDYQTIQEAVDAASPGDIVLASAGTYYENVIIDKTLSLIGEGANTIIDGNGTGTVVSLIADNVYVSWFTIQNGEDYGILLRSDGNTILGNAITKNIFDGIQVSQSNHNKIIQNKISDNGDGPLGLRWGVGIGLSNSNSNIISNNLISNNVFGGISLGSSYDNIVNYNSITNESTGISLDNCYNAGNIISGNVITSNGDGIALYSSTKNTIKHNQIFKNVIGIGIGYSSTNVIKENNITENDIHGIAISQKSTNITVVGNTLSKNQNGIKIHYSDGSIIHHNNFINNTVNAPEDVYPNVNTWDNGYPSGGNYWSDYTNTDIYNGPHQNLTGNDGIGDTPHTLDTRNKDRFPLMAPISFFDAGAWNGTPCEVHVVSNSTISNFQLNKTQRRVSFNVAGPDYTVGFCRVTIANIIVQDLWQNNYTVLVDGNPPLTTNSWTDTTYTHIYFTYLHSEHEVVIIPEFPVAMIPPLFIIITLCTVVLRRKIEL